MNTNETKSGSESVSKKTERKIALRLLCEFSEIPEAYGSIAIENHGNYIKDTVLNDITVSDAFYEKMLDFVNIAKALANDDEQDIIDEMIN